MNHLRFAPVTLYSKTTLSPVALFKKETRVKECRVKERQEQKSAEGKRERAIRAKKWRVKERKSEFPTLDISPYGMGKEWGKCTFGLALTQSGSSSSLPCIINIYLIYMLNPFTQPIKGQCHRSCLTLFAVELGSSAFFLHGKWKCIC